MRLQYVFGMTISLSGEMTLYMEWLLNYTASTVDWSDMKYQTKWSGKCKLEVYLKIQILNRIKLFFYNILYFFYDGG